jgi:hypothetical protein
VSSQLVSSTLLHAKLVYLFHTAIQVVASKCSRSYFSSEKYKQYHHLSYTSFKRVSLCNYTLLPATVKMFETFLEIILWKPFQLFRRILNYVSSITKAPSLHCWFHWREQVKISCSQFRGVLTMVQCCHFVFCQKILEHNRPVCSSIGVKNKPTVGSSFFGAFPSDRVPKATKDVNVHLFIHSSNSCNLYQRIPGTSWSYCVYHPVATACLMAVVLTLVPGAVQHLVYLVILFIFVG